MVFQLRHHPLVQPGAGLDTTAYAELAQKVISGDWGLGPGLYYVSPLYIYFLAAFRGLTGSFTAVRLVQIALGTVGIGAIFYTAREWFGTKAAWIAGLLAAFTGLFTFYEVLILQTSLDVFFTSAALLCLTLALTRQQPRWFLAAGLIFGLQTMNRPNIAVAVIGLAVVMLIVRRWKPTLLLIAGLVIGMSPAAIRNVIVAHEFSLLSSHGGLNFYIGNHEGATGFYQLVPGITPTIKGQQEDTRRVASEALGRSVTDAEASDYFVNRSVSWMSAHPIDAAWLMIRKFGWTFHAQHVALPYSYPFYQYDVPTWLRFYVIGPWLLVPLGLVGLWYSAPRTRHRVDFLIWAAFVPCYAAAVALFFMSERYRLPLLVPLVVAAGGAVDNAWTQIQQRQFARLGAPLVIAVVIGVLINTRGIADDGRWREGLRMADQLVILGRFDEADAMTERLEAKTPVPGLAHESVGDQLLNEHQPARAVTHFRKAVALNQMRYPASFHLAKALQQSGDAAGAASAIDAIVMTREAAAEDWADVGRLATELHALSTAERFFKGAAELAPSSAAMRQQYGVNLVLLGRFEEASRELSEAARLNPRDAASFSHLAYCEAKLGRLGDARQHLATALRLDPGDPMAQQLAAAIR